MDNNTDEHLVALAEDIMIEHGLDLTDVLSLADDVSGMKRSSSYPLPAFEELVVVMLNINEQIPEWLGTDTRVLESFSDTQMEIVLLLIEARFWLGNLQQQSNSFWHWKVVFGSAWPMHRVAVSEEVISGFPKLVQKTRKKTLPWVDLLSGRYTEDFGKGYEVLRAKYFPAGIEDARMGFFKHHHATEYAYRQLEKRCQVVRKHFPQQSSLLEACDKLLHKTSLLLAKLFKIAKVWSKNTRAQKQWWQLPGNSIGLSYSWVTRVDLATNTYELCLKEDDGKAYWRSYNSYQTPIRMEKGSAWREHLFNHQQMDLTTIRRYNVEDNAGGSREQEGPLELMLPWSMYPIWYKYFIKYRIALQEVGNTRMVKDKAVSNIHSKELSLATGEDYWKTRCIKLRLAETEFHVLQEGILKGRPRFDGARNLRLDYLNAALQDMRISGYVKDTRSRQSCAVLKSVDGA